MGTAAAVAGFLFWFALRGQEQLHVDRNLDRTASALEREISTRIGATANGVRNLARHGASLSWKSGEDWRADVGLSVGAFSDLRWVEWVDAAFHPVLVGPEQETRPQAPPEGSPEGELWAEALGRARATRSTVVAGPFAIGSGEAGVRIFVPLASFGASEAYLGGMISASDAFSSLIDHVAPGYAVEIRCEDRVVLRHGDVLEDSRLRRDREIAVPGDIPWSLSVVPEPWVLASQHSRLPDLALFSGLAIALLLGSTVWFGSMARRRAHTLEAAVNERTEDLARALESEQQARLEATEASESKDRFLSIMSHELRNPLGSMRTALEVVRERGAEEAPHMVAILNRQVAQLERLVDDLLDVARIGTGKISLRSERIALDALVEEVAESWSARAGASGLTVETDVRERPVWVDADPARITQVIDNLVRNATLASSEGGTIRISVECPDETHVEVAVTDAGEGIPAEELESLFKPFVQSHRSQAAQKGGLGLGLAIFKGLIEQHGGTVAAESEGLGRGARFSFRLRVRPGPLTADAPPPADPPAATGLRRILVVDDHPDSLTGLAELLRLLGHAVETALDGPSALELVNRERFDVVICDLGLPNMDGYEVAATLRRHPVAKTCLLCALSGFGDEDTVRRALAAGFDHHLTKPADIERLKVILHET